MLLQKIALADTHSFSSSFLDYISQKESLKNFFNRFPTIENFAHQIDEKKTFSAAHRNVLVDTLHRQYEGIKVSEKYSSHVASLRSPNTFTITTGHQLNIFTGPLYFIYKIVTVINTCRVLKKEYPQFNFVPVYWMASEDHDYEEIKSFRLYGKKYSWETTQQGAVGRFDPTGLIDVLNKMPGDISLFKTAYQHDTLANATRYFVNELFGKEGLVVIDADDRALKSELKTVIRNDVFENTPKKLVEEKNAQLQKLGYHPQVFARDINFFYLDKDSRNRIERRGKEFVVVDTAITFSPQAMEQLIEQSPEKFSPNVILRPLYQEIILPNIAYVGGPAEVVYWLQLKGIFEFFNTPFPILMPRNFAAILDAPTKNKLVKTGLDWKDLFEEKNQLFKRWITKNATTDLSLEKESSEARNLFEAVKARATQVDVTLLKHAEAQAQRVVKVLRVIEQKMLRAEKRKHSDHLKQIEAIKESLFPTGSPQERIDNFLNFYQRDPLFIQKLIDQFDPLDFRFNIFYDAE